MPHYLEQVPDYIMPNQMASDKTKQTKLWKENTLNAVIHSCIYNRATLRRDRDDMTQNYGIVRGIISRKDLQRALNPLDLEGDTDTEIFSNDRTYSVLGNVINTLLGEELKRRYETKAYVVNSDAITRKERMIKDEVDKAIETMLSIENLDEEKAAEMLESLEQWKTYSAQDAHERMANQILTYLENDLDLKHKFNEGFNDKLHISEEIYRIVENGEEPGVRRCDSRNIYPYGLGDSRNIQDADRIVEELWMSVSDILDMYGTKLTKEQLKHLVEYRDMGRANNDPKNMMSPLITYGKGYYQDDHRDLATVDTGHDLRDGRDSWYDDRGNVKVYYATWKSFRKIGELTYLDEYGDEQSKFVPEGYKANIDAGEKVEWLYINEWWEGTRIGNNIFIDIKPRNTQMRRMDNPSVCRPPFVGRIGGHSLVDDLAPFAIDYVIYAKKLKELWVSNFGKVARIDVSRIPSGDNWDLETWFKWLTKFKISLENPFEEDGKGHVAGQMQQTSGFYDLSTGSEINSCVQHLEYLEQMIERRSGVSRQRQGDVNTSDGLGTTQQAIIQSATQTEPLFSEHDRVKVEVYETLLATTRELWQGKSEKKQYVLDDMTSMILEINGAEFADSEYGIAMTNSSSITRIENDLKQLGHAALQNGQATLTEVAELWISNSPATKLNSMKYTENKRRKEQQEMQQKQMEAEQQMAQAAQQFELQKMQIEHQYKMKELKLKMQIDLLKLQNDVNNDAFDRGQDDNRNGVEDQVELDKQQIITESNRETLRSKEKIEADKLSHDSKERDKDRKTDVEINKMKLRSKPAK